MDKCINESSHKFVIIKDAGMTITILCMGCGQLITKEIPPVTKDN